MTVVFSVLDPARTYADQKKFDCGHDVINKFVRDSVKGQIKKKLSVGYVLTDSADRDRFVGFFTLAQHAIDVSSLSVLQLGSLPSRIPCTRLIMLGVDVNYKGRQFGKQLMKEVFVATKAISKVAGCYGVYLDADKGAVKFYLDLGFTLLQGDLSPADSPMFLPIASIP